MPDKLPCDAVMIENVAAHKSGSTQYARIDSIASFAEPLLGLDRSVGQVARIRVQNGGKAFITGDVKDTIRYATLDPQGRTGPRYNWVQSTADPDIYLGYLKDRPAPSGDVVVTPATLDGEGTVKGLV